MPLTSSQYAQIQNHVALAWLRHKVHDQKQAVAQDIIKLKITEAINSALAGRATDDNIRDVARRIDVPYGNVFTPPRMAQGLAHPAAVGEIEGTDGAMAATVTMVFNRTAGGRSSPGTSGINHIHVGGNAHQNLLFDAMSYVIYGVVNAHMEGSLSNEQFRVMSRKTQGGAPVTMRVLGDHRQPRLTRAPTARPQALVRGRSNGPPVNMAARRALTSPDGGRPPRPRRTISWRNCLRSRIVVSSVIARPGHGGSPCMTSSWGSWGC